MSYEKMLMPIAILLFGPSVCFGQDPSGCLAVIVGLGVPLCQRWFVIND
jgi:hypothetical protein